MVPCSRLAARLFELSHAQLLEVAVAGCEASPEVTKQAEAILAAKDPLAQRLVDGVLLSSDLAPHVLAPLPLEDGAAAAAVCSLWAEGWKATIEGRCCLTRVALADLPAGVLKGFFIHGMQMAAIPGDNGQLAVSSGDKVFILDRSMNIVSSFTQSIGLGCPINADEQSIYATKDEQHKRLAHDGTELACYADPYAEGVGYGREPSRPVLAPGGLLFCVQHEGRDVGGEDEVWEDEIIALDAHSMQFRYRFGKSLLKATGDHDYQTHAMTVSGEELFVCDMLNDRLQVFSLAGEHRRSITGGWKRPSSLCVIKDRLYLVESHINENHYIRSETYGPLPDDRQTRGRRIFVLSLQGDTLQVYPIPSRTRNSFSSGDLFCFDGKLLVPMNEAKYITPGVRIIIDLQHSMEIVALA